MSESEQVLKKLDSYINSLLSNESTFAKIQNSNDVIFEEVKAEGYEKAFDIKNSELIKVLKSAFSSPDKSEQIVSLMKGLQTLLKSPKENKSYIRTLCEKIKDGYPQVLPLVQLADDIIRIFVIR